jgi:DNA-binding response OmpR family regulator
VRVLYIEDSDSLRRSVSTGLRREGFAVDLAADGERGLWLAQTYDYDVIVLDLMIPGLPGLELLARLNTSGRAACVLILSARDTVEDRVLGLDTGADDYLVKPFRFEELLARIRALVRRRHGLTEDRIEVAGIQYDLRARRTLVGGQPLDLAPREAALLELLVLRRGEVVTRAEIEARIYDERVEPMSNVVESAVSVLRRRLREVGLVDVIETRRGLGYVLGPGLSPVTMAE